MVRVVEKPAQRRRQATGGVSRAGEPVADASGLRQLGAGSTRYPAALGDAELEAIPWRGGPAVHEWDAPEFTSVCPKTAQPDFARIRIRYSPREALIESKSLKLYLFSFRNAGLFHEAVVSKIADDLAEMIRPEWLLVRGEFTPRGGIAIWPLAARVTRFGGAPMAVSPHTLPGWNEWQR